MMKLATALSTAIELKVGQEAKKVNDAFKGSVGYVNLYIAPFLSD